MASFRPIAPLQPSILPRPEIKRKWDDSDTLDLFSKNRRNSNDSQDSPNDQRLRRKEQNRAAQRAFRERKEKYVKELEDRIKEMEVDHAQQIAQLEIENNKLKQELSKYKEKQNESPPHSPAPRNTSSAVACIRDKDGVSFCERLKEEVCSNAYAQLLTEPLFDEFGILNETISEHPVPIVTNNENKTDMFLELEQYLNEKFSNQDSTSVNSSVDLICCADVWKRFSEHPLFDKFDKDDLCDRLRQIAKCSREGPVFDDREVQAVMEFMTIKLETTNE